MEERLNLSLSNCIFRAGWEDGVIEGDTRLILVVPLEESHGSLTVSLSFLPCVVKHSWNSRITWEAFQKAKDNLTHLISYILGKGPRNPHFKLIPMVLLVSPLLAFCHIVIIQPWSSSTQKLLCEPGASEVFCSIRFLPWWTGKAGTRQWSSEFLERSWGQSFQWCCREIEDLYKLVVWLNVQLWERLVLNIV